MVTSLQRINLYNPLNAPWLVGLGVVVLLPALLFSPFLPAWAPKLGLVGLGLIYLLRSLALGRFIGQTPADIPLFILLATLPLGLWVWPDPLVSLPRTYAFVANVAIFWAVAGQRNTVWLPWSGWALMLGGLLVGAFLITGIQSTPTKLPFIERSLYELMPSGVRPFWNEAGFNSNLVGGLTALFLPPIVALMWLGERWQQRDLAKVAAVIVGAIVLLAQSRGALLGLLVALPLVTLLCNRRWLWVWAVVLALVGGWFSYLGPAQVLDSTLSLGEVGGEQTLLGRQELWSRALYVIQDFPLTGVGFDMFEPAVKLLYPLFSHSNTGNFKHAHNLHLQTAVEMGLPALVAHWAFYLTLFYFLLRQARNRRGGVYRTLAIGLLGSLITFQVHGLFEVQTFGPRPALIIWALFGLMMAVATSQPARSPAASRR